MRIGLLAAACFAVGLPSEIAFAQQTAGQLPAVTVDAPVTKKKTASRNKIAGSGQRARNATRSQAAPAAPVAAVAPARAPDANPYADPVAPYKVDRSASSKLTESILNTPRTITAIPKEVVTDKNATSLRELTRTTQGITLGSGEGGNAFGDRVFIRGFDARNDVYLDGLRDPGVGVRETFDVEQIEILKGPSSSIGGRGTTGGALNLVSKKPAPISFYEFSSTFGTDATKRGTFDINQVINSDLALRANGMVQDAHVAGRDFVRDGRWGGALSVAWAPLENFKHTVDYYHVDFNGRGDWGVPFNATTRRPWTESGVDRSNYYGIPDRDFQKSRANILTNTTEYKFNNQISFVNKFRFGETFNNYIAGLPGSVNTTTWDVNIGTQSRYQTNRILVDQPEVTVKFDTGPLNHTVVTGVEVSGEHVSRDAYTGLTIECFPACTGTGIQLNLFNPYSRYVNLTGTPYLTGRPTIVTVDTKAGYILDTVKWGNFILTGGLRVDDYDINSRSAAATGVVTALHNHSRMLNWNTGLTYKILPNASLFAGAATSSNPVGAELDASGVDYGGLGTAANSVFDPEKNTGLEAGTKWEFFNNHLLVTTALFQTTKDNARETSGANIYASAAYRVRGLDFEVAGKLTDELSVFGGVTLMQSEMTKSLTPSNVGRPLANLAHQSVSLLAKYKITPDLEVGGQAVFRSKIRGGTLVSNENILPSFWRFDLLAEYKINEHVSAQLNVINLTNKLYYDAFYRSNTPFTYVAPGRAAYLTMNVKF